MGGPRRRGDGAPVAKERALGLLFFAALCLLALGLLLLALTALPFVVVAFPMTISAVLLVLAVAWVRHRRRR